jgi:glutathione S-transferase
VLVEVDPADRAWTTAQVPTLGTPEGGIFESNAIARYVARLADTGLFGTTLLDTVGCFAELI